MKGKLFMDFENGIIVIDDEIIKPGYTFSDFCKSSFYSGQDEIKLIYLNGEKEIDDHRFVVSLFFRKEKLYMISLICCDIEYTMETEFRRKKLHDEILSKYCIDNEKEFFWGKVYSEYDNRSNLSSINIIYN